MVQPQYFIAHLAHLGHTVRNKNSCHAAGKDFPHLGFTLFPERTVAHGEHFIQYEDIRLHETGNGKREAALHAAGELLERPVLKILKLRKAYDIIVFPVQKIPRIAQQCASQISVFSHRQIGVEAGGQFQQRCNRPVCPDPPLCRHHDARNRFQQR